MKLRSDGSRRDLNDSAWVNSELRRTVWEFNLLREELCRDRFMVEQTCGRPYVPKWAYEASKGEMLRSSTARWNDTQIETLSPFVPSAGYRAVNL